MTIASFTRVNDKKTRSTNFDVVFIHGLSGDSDSSWKHPTTEFHWPNVLDTNNPEFSVGLVDYTAQMLASGPNNADPNINDYTYALLTILKANNIGSRPFVFVCHSLGGILTKAVLRKAFDREEQEDRKILENCRGIQFFATPHRGSGVANIARMSPSPASSVARELATTGGYLQDLFDWFIVQSPKRKIKTRAFSETKKTYKMIVVDKESASPGTVDGSPLAIEANHFEICKFSDASHPMFSISQSFIKECFEIKKPLPSLANDGRQKSSSTDYREHAARYFVSRSKSEYSKELEEDIDLTLAEISQIPDKNAVKQIFRDLVRRTYSDHSADTIGLSRLIPLEEIESQRKVIVPSEKIRAMFHNSHMVEFFFKKMEINGSSLSSSEFADRLTLASESLNSKGSQARNEFLFLEGDVGTGKTTALSHIMHKQIEKFQKGRRVPIRIDMELTDHGDILNVPKFFLKLIPNLSSACQQFFEKTKGLGDLKSVEAAIRNRYLADMPTEISDNSIGQIQSLVADYVGEISEKLKLRFLIIIDNLDAQYHLYDRHLFSIEGMTYRARACDALRLLFESFENHLAMPLGNHGIRVLFVLRPHTKNYLKTAEIRNISRMKPRGVFKLMPPKLPEVVRERNKLLSKLCTMHKHSIHPQEYKYLKNFVEKFSSRTQNLNGGKKVNNRYLAGLNLIGSISSQGLRRSIDHISRYVWLDDDSGSLGHRFSTQYHSQVICFILGDRCRYHQFNSHFPNIFLTRGDKVGHIQYFGDYDDTVKYHPQTYWLKYLVAWYVVNAKPADPDAIFSIFHDNGKCYPKGVVGFCVASLAHIESSNIAKPKFTQAVSGRGLSVDTMSATPQGRKIFNNIVWTFNYLQLIVEDPYLQIPSIFEKEFQYEEGLHYGYFVDSNEEYDTKRARMIELKAKQVFLFLHILESSLACEKRRYPEMFARLEERGFESPNFDKIRNEVEISVVNVLNSGAKTRSNKKDIAAKVSGMKNDAENSFNKQKDNFESTYVKVW